MPPSVDVVCYVPDYNPEHTMVLKAFAEGCKAEVRPVTEWRSSDVAVIYGLYKRKIEATISKKIIIENQQKNGNHIITIDSAPMKRGNYWAVGWGAAIGGRANFVNKNMPSSKRFKSIGAELKPIRTKAQRGKYAVVCGQVPWDANVQDSDHLKWVQQCLAGLDALGIPAMFRPHPKMKLTDYNVAFSNEQAMIMGDLNGTWNEARCLVTWNSTIAVDGLLAGIPVIAMDAGSFAYPIVRHFLQAAHNAAVPLRLQWLTDLAYCQWNLDEMRAGMCWGHLTRLSNGKLPTP